MERYAFGRPIASFQAIKHKLADMYVFNELARSNAYYGAWALRADARELPLAAAARACRRREAFDYASKENIQTHGGIGLHLAGGLPLLLQALQGAGPRRSAGPAHLERQAGQRTRTYERAKRAPTEAKRHGFRRHPRRSRFRAEVRASPDADAKKRRGKRDLSADDMENGAADQMAASKAWQKVKAKAGYARITWPKGMGGIGGTPMQSISLQPGRGEVRRGQRWTVRHRPRHVHPDADDLRHERPRSAMSGRRCAATRSGAQLSEPAGGSDVARPAPARGEERRHLDDQRVQDLDDGRAVLRLRHPAHPHRPQCAQAQGPDHVLRQT